MLDTPTPIVVVEDEPDVLQLLRDVLEIEGYQVIGIGHPRLLRDLPAHPALFLIDLMLPQRSGVDVAKDLRREGFADVPMIAMSASRLMLEVADRSDLFQETLPKPFDLSTLLETVDEYTHEPARGGTET